MLKTLKGALAALAKNSLVGKRNIKEKSKILIVNETLSKKEDLQTMLKSKKIKRQNPNVTIALLIKTRSFSK